MEAENSRIELQEASAGYARGIAQLDAQISEVRSVHILRVLCIFHVEIVSFGRTNAWPMNSLLC